MTSWIDENIKNNSIKYFEFSDFSNIVKINDGIFDEVSKASSASMKSDVALKKVKENFGTIDELDSEVKLLRDIIHPNINRFLGMTKDSFNNYITILKYANEGNLKDYLKNKFTSLKWNDKIQMAFDITCGLKYLHSNGIIHRNLHPKNILVNEGKLLIADFALPRRLEEVTYNELEVFQYIDPECYRGKKKNKKSDIYSLGILLWEITSGYPPLLNIPPHILIFQINNGYREAPIKGTPSKYEQLYKKCWDNYPNLRPDIDEAYETLSQLKTRNLLIVGYTGSGKSTLANVLLSDTVDTVESEHSSISKTKNFQKKNFEWKKTTYCVVDTIGIDNTELTKRNVLHKIAEMIYLMPEGISLVLFVVDGKFTVEEMEAFELFEKAIFDSGIIEYTTIVRTKFSNFNNEEECEKDKNCLSKENKIIDKIVKSCSIVYVDNPPINILVSDNDDEETIRINNKRRITSRNVLLNHLETVCSEKHYKLKTWDELHVKIKNLLTMGQNITKEVEQSLVLEIPELINFGTKVNFIKEIVTNVVTTFKKFTQPINLEEENFKNILIVGCTGSGKSTLTNVLSDSDDSKAEEKQDFKWKGMKYRVIDTTGGRNTKQSIRNIFNKIEEVPEGINQVLFVVDVPFTLEEIRTFERVISKNDIINYITIVRTKFSNFKNEHECKKDWEDLCKESESIAKCSIVYVDNPPISIIVDDDDDDENIINRKSRYRSRGILLDHLEKVCQQKDYKSRTWDKLRNYMYKPESVKSVSKNSQNTDEVTNDKLRNSIISYESGSVKSENSQNMEYLEVTNQQNKNSNEWINDKLRSNSITSYESENSQNMRQSNEWIDWIEEAISKEHIKYYEYNHFKNIKRICRGNFGKVYRANWKHSEQYFALKSFNLDCVTIKEIVRELQLHRKVDFHKNIINFRGITVSEKNDRKKYLLVMDYADSGSLRDYLKENFRNLTWEDKYKFAYQLASAVLCLHDEKIMHCDLHSSNILIHLNSIKLVDFGLSRRIDEVSKSQAKLFGIVPYIDPKRLENSTYPLNEKCDVYSVGVLLWEISSGQVPFKGELYDVSLVMKILEGYRETIVSDTPIDYSDLYTECWNGEPDNRPTMNQVVAKLKTIIIKETHIIISECYQTDYYGLNNQLSNEQQPTSDDCSLHSGELFQLIQKGIEPTTTSSNNEHLALR